MTSHRQSPWLRVLTLSSLFPDASRPNFGLFVERQTAALAGHADVDLKVVAPVGLPPFPLNRAARYAGLRALPAREQWHGLDVYRPRFRHWPGLGGRFDAPAMAEALLPLLKAIRAEFPFDVIDAEFFFPDGPAAIRLGAALGVPVSIKARGSDIHFWGHQSATRDQVVEAGCRADGLMAVSAALKADMVALGMPGERIAVTYTGVDSALYAPRDRAAAKAELGKTGPLIVSVGTVSRAKGHHLVIEALASLPSVTLVVIGKGPDRARFEALASELGVADRVSFTGALPPTEVAKWLVAADVMVLASAAEGLANAWVEALSCGTPIVITDTGGAREVMTTAAAGRIVAAEPAAIAAAVTAVIANPPEPSTVRAAAARFTWDANRDAVYAHLAGLISG